MIRKFIFSFTLTLSQYVVASPDIIQRIWNDNSGYHILIIKKINDLERKRIGLVVRKFTEGNEDWVLMDYIENCGEDIKLDVVNNSVEVNKFFFLVLQEQFCLPTK